jgi:MoxR-like ATPase
MLAVHAGGDRVLELAPVASVQEIMLAQRAAVAVHASAPLREYIVALLARTREDRRTALGASPRAGLMLLKAAKASAVLSGRDHALPDDVKDLAASVLAHRIVLAPTAQDAQREAVVADALRTVPAL